MKRILSAYLLLIFGSPLGLHKLYVHHRIGALCYIALSAMEVALLGAFLIMTEVNSSLNAIYGVLIAAVVVAAIYAGFFCYDLCTLWRQVGGDVRK